MFLTNFTVKIVTSTNKIYTHNYTCQLHSLDTKGLHREVMGINSIILYTERGLLDTFSRLDCFTSTRCLWAFVQ